LTDSVAAEEKKDLNFDEEKKKSSWAGVGAKTRLALKF
jgi:hypothetical protein